MTLNNDDIIEIITDKIKGENKNQIAKILISNCSSTVIDGITKMMIKKNKIYEFQPGDYFKAKPPYGHLNRDFYQDILSDIGLYKDGYVFGKVLKSNDFKAEHDPFYIYLSCTLLYGKDNPEHDFSIFDITKIEKNEIPLYNGTHIRRIIELSHPGVFDTIEE